jgi:hypothetical protein
MNKNQAKRMREALANHIGDWEQDASIPPNWVRKTGLGEEVARVDRWNGGYQSPHAPVLLGWQVKNPSAPTQIDRGVVRVERPEDKESVGGAIGSAQILADAALTKLMGQAKFNRAVGDSYDLDVDALMERVNILEVRLQESLTDIANDMNRETCAIRTEIRSGKFSK